MLNISYTANKQANYKVLLSVYDMVMLYLF